MAGRVGWSTSTTWLSSSGSGPRFPRHLRPGGGSDRPSASGISKGGRDMKKLQPHPIAEALIPSSMTDEATYQRLKASIARHDLLDPIMLYQGKILDGRLRYRACQELGVEVFHGEFFEAEMGMTP